MIRIGFYGTASDIPDWESSLAARLPDFEIVELMSEAGAASDVALVWAPPRDAFSRCAKLRGIIMQGQGVDHMMRDETVPRDIPLVRSGYGQRARPLGDPECARFLAGRRGLSQPADRRISSRCRSAPPPARIRHPGVGDRHGDRRRFAALGFEVRSPHRSELTGLPVCRADQLAALPGA